MLYQAIKITGSYDPDITLSVFFDELTNEEYHTLYDFLKWVHNNNRAFGSANFVSTYSEWLNYTKVQQLQLA